MHEYLRIIALFRPFYRDFEEKFVHKRKNVLFCELLPVKATDGVGISRRDFLFAGALK